MATIKVFGDVSWDQDKRGREAEELLEYLWRRHQQEVLPPIPTSEVVQVSGIHCIHCGRIVEGDSCSE